MKTWVMLSNNSTFTCHLVCIWGRPDARLELSLLVTQMERQDLGLCLSRPFLGSSIHLERVVMEGRVDQKGLNFGMEIDFLLMMYIL